MKTSVIILIINIIYILYQNIKYINIININSSSTEFELVELKNRAIQFHLSGLNFLKNLMNSLKVLETSSDIKTAMIINDELAEILNKAESHYKNFVEKFNFSKESLELYILFLRNSMNRADLAV